MNEKQQNFGLTDAAKLRKWAGEQARTVEPISLSAQTPETIQQILQELRRLYRHRYRPPWRAGRRRAFHSKAIFNERFGHQTA